MLTPSNYSLSLCIAGDVGGEAVLVMKDSTYTLIRSETSNAMLVCENKGVILLYWVAPFSCVFFGIICVANNHISYTTLAVMQQVASPPGFGSDSSTRDGVQVIVANCPSVIELEKAHTTVS